MGETGRCGHVAILAYAAAAGTADTPASGKMCVSAAAVATHCRVSQHPVAAVVDDITVRSTDSTRVALVAIAVEVGVCVPATGGRGDIARRRTTSRAVVCDNAISLDDIAREMLVATRESAASIETNE